MVKRFGITTRLFFSGPKSWKGAILALNQQKGGFDEWKSGWRYVFEQPNWRFKENFKGVHQHHVRWCPNFNWKGYHGIDRDLIRNRSKSRGVTHSHPQVPNISCWETSPACQCGDCTSESDIDILCQPESQFMVHHGLLEIGFPNPIIRSIQVDFVHLNFSTSSRSFGQLGFPPATRCETSMGRSPLVFWDL